MSYNVISIAVFERQAKRLIRKYPSLKGEILYLIEKLKKEPEQGIALGNHCFKIRIAIASKCKGRSGGGRVITNIIITEKTVYLLFIYDKSERENLSARELNELLQFIPE